MLRSFIAIEIPPTIQDAISCQTESLKGNFPTPSIRWVPSNNIHLTLKFLGETSPQNIDQLARSLEIEINQIEPFSIPFSETGIFPNVRKPRIIWIGLSHSPKLVIIHKLIESVTATFGFKREERSFSPHITLGRVNEIFPALNYKKLLEDIRSIDISIIEELEVKSVTIFKSDLKPKGPIYTAIHSIPFNKMIH
jgi:2'-5' RNA ligase